MVGPLSFTSIATPDGPRFEISGKASLASAVSINSVPRGR
jgi:hypothetical protein